MPRSPLSTDDLLPRVQVVLDGWVSTTRDVLQAVDDDCAGLADAVAELVGSGKRLRAGFCYWAWRGAGAADSELIIEVAAALELLQASALLHDDLIDHSDTRRGKPAAHRRMATMHRDRGWLGDPDDFGVSAALLAGDLCLAGSEAMLHTAISGLPGPRRQAGAGVFTGMLTELMAGQYLDILVGVRPDRGDPVEQARKVITFKTVNYTVAKPLALGGTLAGAEPATLDAYAGYAAALGEAFQLRDDVLGVFGDPDITGKPAGDDLREGKNTVLVALARQRADDGQRTILARLGDPDLDDDGIDALRQVLRTTGALADVESRIAQLAEEATARLADGPITAEARTVLTALVGAATRRDR